MIMNLYTQSWTRIQKPFRLNFSISEVTGAPTELLPRLSPSSHQPFLLAYCFPVSLLTVLRPPRCSFNRSKKRFLGAVLITFSHFPSLPLSLLASSVPPFHPLSLPLSLPSFIPSVLLIF